MKCVGVQCGCAFIQKWHNICYALKMGHCWIIQYRSLEVRKPPNPTQPPMKFYPIERTSRWRRKTLRLIRWTVVTIVSMFVIAIVIGYLAGNSDDTESELVTNDNQPASARHEPKEEVSFTKRWSPTQRGRLLHVIREAGDPFSFSQKNMLEYFHHGRPTHSK